jgi:endonuclease/exonuclease/phosphatase family metal-dependent hydrolase
MTFNVRLDGLADGANAWASRRDMVAATILFFDADVAGLQEPFERQVRDLAARLPGYAWAGVGRDDGKSGGEFNPIFFKKDRFREVGRGVFWLSESPDQPGLKGWDAACPRLVTWLRLRDGAAGAEFFVFNTHFDHVGEIARRRSAELLRARTAALAGRLPVVITGDFNCGSADEPYRILTGEGGGAAPLLDARRLARLPVYGGETSLNGFSDEPRPGILIDHIFVRNVGAVLRSGVIADRWDGHFVSDHYPVLAEIDLKGK